MKELTEYLEEYNDVTYEEIEDNFKDMLDECYEPVELAGMTIVASDMKDIDPIMFRCSCADYSSEEYEEHEDKYYLKDDYNCAMDLYENQDKE